MMSPLRFNFQPSQVKNGLMTSRLKIYLAILLWLVNKPRLLLLFTRACLSATKASYNHLVVKLARLGSLLLVAQLLQ